MRSGQSSSRTNTSASTGSWSLLRVLSMVVWPTGTVVSVSAFALTRETLFLVPFVWFVYRTVQNQE